jgi:hypothetical protein
MENIGWKGWEWSDFNFGALKVVAPPCVNWELIVWPRWTRLIMYWRIRDLWGPANLVASTVAELDDTLPRFMDIQWDSVWASHGVPVEVFMWKMALGRGRTRSWLFDSHRERWWLMVPSWLTCVVLSGYFPCMVYIDSSLCDTLGHGLFVVVIL